MREAETNRSAVGGENTAAPLGSIVRSVPEAQGLN